MERKSALRNDFVKVVFSQVKSSPIAVRRKFVESMIAQLLTTLYVILSHKEIEVLNLEKQ